MRTCVRACVRACACVCLCVHRGGVGKDGEEGVPFYPISSSVVVRGRFMSQRGLSVPRFLPSARGWGDWGDWGDGVTGVTGVTGWTVQV